MKANHLYVGLSVLFSPAITCAISSPARHVSGMQQVAALKAQRDVKSRELAKMTSARKATIEQSKVRATCGVVGFWLASMLVT